MQEGRCRTFTLLACLMLGWQLLGCGPSEQPGSDRSKLTADGGGAKKQRDAGGLPFEPPATDGQAPTPVPDSGTSKPDAGVTTSEPDAGTTTDAGADAGTDTRLSEQVVGAAGARSL